MDGNDDNKLNLIAKTSVYTKCYCEENVWKLCESVRGSHPSELDHCYCVFISNQQKTIPLWCQQAGHGEEGFVVWDYHVILIHANPQHSSSVYDLDTTLSFPVSFKEYLEKGIRDNQSLREQYWRMFRVIPAREFLARFASDRSHMLKENGEWMMPPPTYPCIRTHDSTNNIEDFISMDPHIPHGDILTVEQLASKFLYLS